MNATVVVGYNGSSSAAEAVMWAASEATLRNAALRIVSCFDLPTVAADAYVGFGAGAACDVVREVAATNAEQISASVTVAHPALTFTTAVVPGPASTALLADLAPTDLVVVGSSHHDGAAAFWLGSTPRHLVHDSPCPVAVIRSTASRDTPDRVVVGVDGSPASELALTWACDEADRHQVELVLVHGWSYPYAPTNTSSTQARELTEIDADCTLTRATEAARERCGVTVTGVLIEGSAVSALLATVRDGDLLVVGSRGRGGIKSRLFGSTANSILDHAAVPVVVVRADPADEPASAPREAALRLA
jgi:nucleotide-binding universal stress UspA family protein